MHRALLKPVRRAGAAFHSLQAASHAANTCRTEWEAGKAAASAAVSAGTTGGVKKEKEAEAAERGLGPRPANASVSESDALASLRLRAIAARREARRCHGALS